MSTLQVKYLNFLVCFSICTISLPTLADETDGLAPTLDSIGQWSPTIDWGIPAIHAILTPNEKILTYGRGAVEYSVWDPALGTGPESRYILPNNTYTDIFCSSSILLPESGVVMITGGDIDGEGNDGNTNTTFYNSVGDDLYAGNRDLAYARWYPTTTTLPHGEILAQGGAVKDPGSYVTTPEIYNPEVGLWRTLDNINSEYAYRDYGWWYPRTWVAPNGLLFSISKSKMYYIDYRDSGNLVGIDTFLGDNTHESSSAVMYRPGKILQIGGGGEGNVNGSEATDIASIIDINELVPAHQQVAPLNYARHWPDTTVLPDGQVLVTGGSQLNNVLEGQGPAYSAEIWNPDTDEWAVMDAEEHPRLYHSIAILLPDATVLTAGGGEPGPVTNRNAQIFHPPYLYNGDQLAPRPVIQIEDTIVEYNSVVQINVDSGIPIDKISLIKTGSVTHSFNNEQRYMELDFIATGDQLVAELPVHPFDAPPGYYLLFAIDAEGTPSVAEMLHFKPDQYLDLSLIPIIEEGDFKGRCDYSQAGIHFGYGWNELKQSSCPPEQDLSEENSDGGGCDYSSADLYDGYGWNEDTMESCPPIDSENENNTIGECDYTDAILYDGYGWNEVAMESCPPIITPTDPEVIAGGECDYTDASLYDGYGWNELAMESCPPIVIVVPDVEEENHSDSQDGCDYSTANQNNGFGWNEVTGESCPPLAATVPSSQDEPAPTATSDCDYSAADQQNGWGWNSVENTSCPPLSLTE